MVKPTKQIDVTDAAKAFFLGAPKWVSSLMQFRNKLVTYLGLKTDQQQEKSIEAIHTSNFEIGEKFGLFEVTNRTKNEIIMGTDDKHLNFRVSIYLKDCQDKNYTIYLTTAVQINNALGKIYFFVIKPFHKIVVRVFIKKIKEQLINQ